MPRQYFAFRFEWLDNLKDLAKIIRLEVYEAAVHYAMTGERTEMSPRAAEAFEKYILPVFRRREKAAEYRARRKARLAAEAAEAAVQQVEILQSIPVRPEPTDTDVVSPVHKLKIFAQAPPELF